MKHPNRIFDRYKRSAGGSRTSPPPPPNSVQSLPPQRSESTRPSASRERSPQQQHYQHSSPQTGQYTFPSLNSNHTHQVMDPPPREPLRNTAFQRNIVPPLSSIPIQDMSNTQVRTHRHSAQSRFDQSDDSANRWREIETIPGGSNRNGISNQRGNANTSNNGRQTYDSSNRRDYYDNGDRPFMTSIALQSNTNSTTESHPASVIISPNYDDDDDHLPSSVSSRLSFAPWDAVQPPPFIQEVDDCSNNYYNYPVAPATERPCNYADHEPYYNNCNAYTEYYNYHSERVLPTHGFNDTSSQRQWKSFESEPTRYSNPSGGNNFSSPTTPMGAGKEQKMIEITPGNMALLRDAKETITAIQNDFYVPCTCVYCDVTSSSPYNPREPIFCIQDAEYFLCPTCASINRLEVDHYGSNASSSSSKNGAFHMLGGVGLGFTMKTLLEVQRDYVSKHRN